MKKAIPTKVKCEDTSSSTELMDVTNHSCSHHSVQSFHSVDAIILDYKDVMIANRVWDALKQVQDHEAQFGEAVFLHLMEKDPQARVLLQVTSIRSKRFDQVSKEFFELADLIFSSLNFDWQDNVDDIRKEMQQVLPTRLRRHYASAVTRALEMTILEKESPVLSKVLHSVMEQVMQWVT